MDENKKSSSYAIPGAIVIAGLIIAGAIYYKGQPGATDQPAAVASGEQAGQLEQMRPIDGADHILGNPNAPIKIIEYSDLECPFCKTFHQTMHQLVNAYPTEIAWVYRHFPLDQLHSKARKEAEASECAYELGGHEKFWAYADQIFAITPSNDGLEPARLPEVAEQIGLDRRAFETCLASGRTAARVDADYQNAVLSGGRGTPFPVVIGPDNKKIALEGAIPFAGMKQLVDALLSSPNNN